MDFRSTLDDQTVSVVIPSFNRKSEVLTAVKSALAQSFMPMEVIVVDDGSTDGTREIDFESIDPRIRFIPHKQNKGGGAARNTGIDAAKGKYIALLDSDDIWSENKLEKQLQSLSAMDDMVFSSCNIERVRSIGSAPYNSRPFQDGEDLSEYLLIHKCTLHTSTLVVPTPLAQKVRFDPSLKRHQDWDFVLRLFEAGAKVRYLHETLAIYDCQQVGGRITSLNDVRPTLTWYDLRDKLISPRAKYEFYVRNWMTRHLVQKPNDAFKTYLSLSENYKSGRLSIAYYIVAGFAKDFARSALRYYSSFRSARAVKS
jgi:glycosyltransferase involved in cell wall biosynthesis